MLDDKSLLVQVEELQRVREQLEAQVEALAAQMRALDDENARLRVRNPTPIRDLGLEFRGSETPLPRRTSSCV